MSRSSLIYAIRDIRGQLWKLHSLLQRIEQRGLTADDRLVFLGDYVDRGPDSSGVLDLLISLKFQRPNSVFVRGNYDQVSAATTDGTSPREPSVQSPDRRS